VISSSQTPLPDNTQHSQQTDIHAPVGFEPTISEGERPNTHALDSAATGTGEIYSGNSKYCIIGNFCSQNFMSLEGNLVFGGGRCTHYHFTLPHKCVKNISFCDTYISIRTAKWPDRAHGYMINTSLPDTLTAKNWITIPQRSVESSDITSSHVSMNNVSDKRTHISS